MAASARCSLAVSESSDESIALRPSGGITAAGRDDGVPCARAEEAVATASTTQAGSAHAARRVARDEVTP
jgi:hypothetical protein